MIRPWPDISTHFATLRQFGMLRLVREIEGSRYIDGIYGWTSVVNLAISQYSQVTYPDVGPHLLVSPVGHGKLEFRLVDTDIRLWQWTRVVDEQDGFKRLERFFLDMHWFADAGN